MTPICAMRLDIIVKIESDKVDLSRLQLTERLLWDTFYGRNTLRSFQFFIQEARKNLIS